MTDESLLDVIKGLVNTGMRLRFVTKITQENISYCKQLMKYTAAVFHVDRVIGNFLILDGRKYMFYVVDGELYCLT
jgi:two-component system sensor histidine kinase VicK